MTALQIIRHWTEDEFVDLREAAEAIGIAYIILWYWHYSGRLERAPGPDMPARATTASLLKVLREEFTRAPNGRSRFVPHVVVDNS